MDDPRDLKFREIRQQQIFDRTMVIVRAKFPKLTESQHKGLAEAMQKHGAFVEFTNNGTLDPGDDWIAYELDAQEYLAKGQGSFRIAPDAKALEAALIAALPESASPYEPMNIARRVAKMSADERLAASENLDLTKPAHKMPASAGTPDQRARASGYTAEDKEWERRTGRDVRDLTPDKRMEIRRELAKERAPKSTPALDQVRVHRKLGKEPAPTTLMTAAREAKELGKTLEEALK